MRILVVEDDLQMADMLAEALANQQYAVDLAPDGEVAWDCIATSDYDLIVLDVTLPKLDGIGLCRQLRDRRFHLPVLMLTARDTTADKIVGLDAGADDYMVKPFEIGELMARIRALLRRGRDRSRATLSWGELLLDSGTYEVTYRGQPLSLTPKEYGILELLVSQGRRVVSRAGIIDRVWSLTDFPTEETVKSHIKNLRHKLKIAGAPEDAIETVHGLGYRLKDPGI